MCGSPPGCTPRSGSVIRGANVMKAESRIGRTRGNGFVSVPFPDTEPHEQKSRNDVIPPLRLAKVLQFSIPALGAVLADPLMSLVDTACVGQVSSIGLAALGPNTAVFGFVSMVFQFFSVSTTGTCFILSLRTFGTAGV